MNISISPIKIGVSFACNTEVFIKNMMKKTK